MPTKSKCLKRLPPVTDGEAVVTVCRVSSEFRDLVVAVLNGKNKLPHGGSSCFRLQS
jgi:hypothetical protein